MEKLITCMTFSTTLKLQPAHHISLSALIQPENTAALNLGICHSQQATLQLALHCLGLDITVLGARVPTQQQTAQHSSS
jgi:hypothetical protein